MTDNTILESLNDAQLEAVTAPLAPLLILAGAGSGKTRVLVHRIAWLLHHERLPAHSIMAVTFTNKAAGEMRLRIEQLIKTNLKGMWVGTFHGLSHRLLRLHWNDAGLSQNFQILDQDDQLQIIKRLVKSMQLDDKQWPPKQAQWYINGKKDAGLRPQYIDPGYSQFEQTMLSIYQTYHDYCNKSDVVDFSELLLRAHELILNKPHILEHYRDRFRYIMVDEFQDTNNIQYAWLRLLTDGKNNLMVVGDDDQSIYGWRGANVKNIQDFSKDYPDAKTVRLEQNYRSSDTILQAANAVISCNPDRLGKKLWTEDNSGQKIKIYSAMDEIEEANFIGKRILKEIEQGATMRNIAILYRSNAQSRILEQTMLRLNIPYRIYGGQRFFERAEIKNALAYMKLINNPNDNGAIERIINVPTRGIGAKTIEKLRATAQTHNLSLWQSISQSVTNPSSGKSASSLANFVTLINDLSSNKNDHDLGKLAEDVLNLTGLLEHHGKEKGEKGQSRVENLNELIAACRSFEPEDLGLSEDLKETQPDSINQTPLSAFLSSTALEAGDTQANPSSEFIQMMTLHSAKGLEFPIVFLTGLEEKLFPHSMSLQEGNVEEERRLCYVGITRTKKQLYLTYAVNRNLYGEKSYRLPSRFIEEIPKHLLEKIQSMQIFPSSNIRTKTTISPHAFKLGQRVHHNNFGEGIVLKYEGSGNDARIHINFDYEGKKWLMLSYANLSTA